ncbi:MAG: tetratricopeptide repeat protein [Verrucomicrobia bacterium]|nr:tetratricopeptide repeat protein [Verrucomicrobiota bacterium]
MSSLFANCLRRPGCVCVCVFIATTGLTFGQQNLDKKAVQRPASTPVKASPVTAGKATPVTAGKAIPVIIKAPATIKAAPIVITPNNKDVKNSTALEDQLSYANLLFSHKQYAIAIRQYELFLNDNSQSSNAASAAFRLGECYLQLSQVVQAKQAYARVIKQYKAGVYAGASAFRLATLYFNEKNYAKAIPYFDVAIKNINDPKLELQALYYGARCMQLDGKKEKAITIYEQLLAEQGQSPKNPFAEPSRVAIARIYAELDNNEKALAAFKVVIAHSKDAELLDEAHARGGLIAAKLGKRKESSQMLDKVLQSKSGKTWKALSQIGLIFNQFSAADYEGVIRTYNQGIYDAPADSRAQMLLLAAHSYRLTKQLKQAADVYGIVERNFRDRIEGTEAGYRRLQCLHLLSDGGLPVYAGSFVEQQRKIDPKSKYLDLALLMKAEWHFEHNEFADAAKAYAEVRPANIPKEHHIPRLYKLGWSQVEGGQIEAGISSLTKFLQAYPDDPLAPSVLAKRGNAYQKTDNPKRALKDFETLSTRYSDSNELEFALQQIAIIQLAQKDTPAMISAFLDLLKKFPDTEAKAEAHFWIGSGYIQQKKYAQAIPFLDKARQINAKTYYEVATRRIILASYQMEDIEALTKETEKFLSEKRKLTIPLPIFTYLGIKLFEREKFAAAARFLDLSSSSESPEQSRPEVWNYLGRANLELKRYSKAIGPLDIYLSFINRPSLRAKTYVYKGNALLGLKNYADATKTANEAMRLQKEGRINATARILLGDISLAQNDYENAARLYLIVSQIFVDPLITPLALQKASTAYEKAGQNEKAKQLQEKLKEKYPSYEAP